ncbi:hypothetical protein F53441_2711 [Fusarium austroafricanum]|uniref:Uncharacterized protein n=1 Tax=Fusarium austroafricanum TaxID=2364996 RepID=A0A8H4KRN1_9HYPO|nr:hypothetical protein F53441_2711 [Fusarium austroafricanum]
MTRALELAWKYCKESKERLIVYVEDVWIQCMVESLFVVAGFNVGTVRASDEPKDDDEIIAEWNDPTSDLEILVANVETAVMDVNMHTCCFKALILDWPLEPDGILRTLNHMVQNCETPAIIHMPKIRDGYYDVVERIFCTKWAMQLSQDINLPEWITGAIREICVFEMIKTAWHQPFNRYAWIVNHDLREHQTLSYSLDDTLRLGHVFSIAAKLILLCSQGKDKDFWTGNEGFFVDACFHCMESYKTEELEAYLSQKLVQLKNIFLPHFQTAIRLAQSQIENYEEYHERHDMLRCGVEDREEVSAESGDELEEGETLGDDDGAVEGEEGEQGEQYEAQGG